MSLISLCIMCIFVLLSGDKVMALTHFVFLPGISAPSQPFKRKHFHPSLHFLSLTQFRVLGTGACLMARGLVHSEQLASLLQVSHRHTLTRSLSVLTDIVDSSLKTWMSLDCWRRSHRLHAGFKSRTLLL